MVALTILSDAGHAMHDREFGQQNAIIAELTYDSKVDQRALPRSRR
jgi:hypothetical protein